VSVNGLDFVMPSSGTLKLKIQVFCYMKPSNLALTPYPGKFFDSLQAQL